VYDKSLEILEFPRIREILAGFTASQVAIISSPIA